MRGQHLLAVLPVGSVTDPVLCHGELAPVKGENGFRKGICISRDAKSVCWKYHTPSAKILKP